MDSSQAKIKNSLQISYLAKGKKESSSVCSTSFELLKEYGTELKSMNGKKLNEQTPEPNPSTPTLSCQLLSTDRIMKLARARLLELKSQKADAGSFISGDFEVQSGLSAEASQDLKLALLLQAAAEKVTDREFLSAAKLLNACNKTASVSGNPVQRIVYYFGEALKERIDRQWWGRVTSGGLEGKNGKPMDVQQALISMQPASVACQQQLPFSLVTQFTSIQSILDSVSSAKRVHIIDFGINTGSHWTIMMQAFAVRVNCPIEILKITAVGTSKEIMEQTGNRLSSFAETMNLSFSFKMVVSDLKDLKVDLFDIEAGEAVAVYMAFRLWTVLAWPKQLESLIRLIKKIKPCVMLVKEVEASTNSPNFMERFYEALFLFSAIFDCVEVCIDNHPFRKFNEESTLRKMIQNIITTEGTQRIHRHERITFWRALFARHDIIETELSNSCLLYTSSYLITS